MECVNESCLELGKDPVPQMIVANCLQRIGRRVPAQDVPFFYTPSHLCELQSFKSIISTHVHLFSYLNSVRHNLVIELYREQK